MPPHLLVIEDDVDSLDLLVMLLESCGFTTVGTTRSAQAREHLARNAFDVVLADFLVDSRDPTAAWKALDEEVSLAKPTPVMLLTAWPIQPAQVSEHGLACVIRKPCPSEVLLSHLSDVLDVPPLDDARAQLLRDYFACLEAGDYDRLVALCTEDVAYYLPSADPELASTVHGRAAFRELSQKTFESFREPRFEIHEMRPLPRGVVVRYTGSWTEAGTGEERALPGAVLFVLRDLQIAEIGVRVDVGRMKQPQASSVTA